MNTHSLDNVSPDMLLEQMELEQGMTQLGIERYRRRLRKDVERSSESETAYGSTILTRCTSTVAEGIDQFISKALQGGGGRRHSSVKYLRQLDSRLAAYLALRNVLQSVSRLVRLQTVAIAIGKAIEDEVRFEEVRAEDRRYYKWLKDEAKKRDDYRNKRSVVVYNLNRHGHEWESWPLVDRKLIGMKLLEIIMESVGLVTVEHHYDGSRKKTSVYLAPTDETKQWIMNRNASAELLSPIYEPMIVPPRPWSTPFDGGYLTRHVRPLKMVKSSSKGYMEELENMEMPEVYGAVNAAQATSWKVNEDILEVLSLLWDNSSTSGGIPSKYDLEVPHKPLDIEENEEARKDWRRAAAQVHRANRELLSQRTQFSYAIATASKYRSYSNLYFPCQLDFRGRLYSVPLLNPQGPDWMKAMLTFAEGKPIDEESSKWLAIHIANCGAFDKVDKEPLEARVAWVYNNEQRIYDTGKAPFDDLWWSDADKPFQFLAACIEWAGYCDEGDGYLSHLPIALDGSCSGIQHFSLALRDEIGGAAVNLTITDKPADIYTLVKEKVYEQLHSDAENTSQDEERGEIARQWLQFQPDRSCFKRPTMTYGYGSREFGFRDQIMADTLRPAKKAFEQGQGVWPFEEDGFAASLYMAKAIAAAVDATVIKAAEAMRWLKETARLISSEQLPVRWTVPDGFPVLQAYRDLKSRQVDTMLCGSRIVLSVTEELETVDRRAQEQGIAPNYVHSLDATHLRMTVQRASEEGLKSFALVHDSFGTHAADTGRFFQLVREAMVEMYETTDVVEDFRREMEEQLTPENRGKLKPPPTKGTLDPRQVLGSAYAFA